jgi:cytidylate kinase
MTDNMGIITIDGPAGSGKSTVSKALANILGFVYLDTGAMYRAVALEAKRNGVPIQDGLSLGGLCLNLDIRFEAEGDRNRILIGDDDVSDEIRTPEMDMLSSNVSAVFEVREAMTELQRKIGAVGGVVAEGRDMGTVVFPEACNKFFITASQATRAERRYRERLERGEKVTLEGVEEELGNRDQQDESRDIAPLRPAKDALVIDTSDMTVDQVVSMILERIEACE